MTYYLQQNKSREVLSPAILGHIPFMVFLLLYFLSLQRPSVIDKQLHYSAHSPFGLFSGRLHQLLCLIILPSAWPRLFILTTITILLS